MKTDDVGGEFQGISKRMDKRPSSFVQGLGTLGYAMGCAWERIGKPTCGTVRLQAIEQVLEGHEFFVADRMLGLLSRTMGGNGERMGRMG